MTAVALWAWRIVRAGILTAVAVATPVLAVVVAIAVLVLSPLPGTVPEPQSIPVGQPTVLLAADGSELASLRGFDLNLPTTPQHLTDLVVASTVAAEDRNFFEHTGVDPSGIARAFVENISAGGVVQGGSTITQQLVKNRYLDNSQTPDRKVREAILAQRLETELTKDEILLAYLSESYFGSGAYGLAAAASVYFDKDPVDLRADEVAMIVGMLPFPSGYSPHVDPAAATAARDRTLQAMVETDAITPEEFDRLTSAPVVVSDQAVAQGTGVTPLRPRDLGRWPHVTAYVEDYLVRTLGPEAVLRGGLTVTTTLSIPRQEAATEAVQRLAADSPDPTVGAALAAVDPRTGFIEALASSSDWNTSQVNLATGGATGFQVGSSAKPFVLAAVVESGVSPSASVTAGAVYTTPEGAQLRNFDRGGWGTTSIRQAVVNSGNTPLLVLAEQVGPDTVAATARRLGISSWGPERSYGVSVALGAYETSPLEMASAFGTFAARGERREPVPVSLVTDRAGTVLLDNRQRLGEQALDPVVADHVTDVLTGVVTSGTGTAARLDRPVAGKTGTAENFSAAWFVGYTPELSAAVWIGHVDGVRPLGTIRGVSGITGGSLPASLWREFMVTALDGVPAGSFVSPAPLGGPRYLPGQGPVGVGAVGVESGGGGEGGGGGEPVVVDGYRGRALRTTPP